MDFLGHIFWDKYIEYEERLEAPDKIYRILDRVIHIPLHQYARYFERFTMIAQGRPLSDLLPKDVLSSFRKELLQEPVDTIQAGAQKIKMERGELEIERELRVRIHNLHLEIFHKTQVAVTRRWPYEAEIKRPYFHVTELPFPELVNWRRYLDFEEIEGDFTRIVALYERCLTSCALYDEFWLRYARWMSARFRHNDDVRNIYQRASAIFVPISRPFVRYQYAAWEESQFNTDVAREIYKSVLSQLPGHAETTIYWANMERRLTPNSIDSAVEVYQTAMESDEYDPIAKAILVTEWIQLVWKLKGDMAKARSLYETYSQEFLESKYFYLSYFKFELGQPSTMETSTECHARISALHHFIRTESRLPPLTIKDISHEYMQYLLTRGPAGAMDEYMFLDREVNGPFSVQIQHKIKLSETGRLDETELRLKQENGHPGVRLEQPYNERGIYDRALELQGLMVPKERGQ